jgi:hypothetical protein
MHALSTQPLLPVTISTEYGMCNLHVHARICKYLVKTTCNTVLAPLYNIQKLCVKHSDKGRDSLPYVGSSDFGTSQLTLLCHQQEDYYFREEWSLSNTEMLVYLWLPEDKPL